MAQLNCSNCPWGSDREACRACRQEQELTAKEVHEAMDADSVFQSFVTLAGEEHRHYDFSGVDPVEYTQPKYGHQN